MSTQDSKVSINLQFKTYAVVMGEASIVVPAKRAKKAKRVKTGLHNSLPEFSTPEERAYYRDEKERILRDILEG